MHSSSDAQKRRRRKWHRYDLENVGPSCDDDEDEARTHSREGALSTVRWISQGDGQQEPDYTCTLRMNGEQVPVEEKVISCYTLVLYIYIISFWWTSKRSSNSSKSSVNIEPYWTHLLLCCCYYFIMRIDYCCCYIIGILFSRDKK